MFFPDLCFYDFNYFIAMEDHLNKEQELWLVSSLLSSSSDSDEEYYPLLVERKTLPKIKNFESIISKFDEKQFQRYFRMKKETANILIEKFKQSLHFPNNEGHGGRFPITASVHVYSFLWFAGNKSTVKDVSQRFDMTESSFHRVMDRMLNFLLDLGPVIIKMPKTRDVKEIFQAEFQKISGFPGVLGCIDGTSIPIITPVHKIKSTYVNRHDIPCITLQGICDYKRRFIDIFTGIPGKVHDARVYKMSDISKLLPEICDGNKYHILGDGAYPIKPWLLIPYKDYGSLTQEQIKYNKKFSATRVLIENTFGILKGRFRQLIRLDMTNVPTLTKFIIACCILHNFCIDYDDFIDDADIFYDGPNVEQEKLVENEYQLKKQGEDKRDHIKNSFRYTG